MNRILIFSNLVFILLLISCETENNKKHTELVNQETLHENNTDSLNTDSSKVQFDFFAKENKENKKNIEVKASLYNNNTDTIYFLSYTCQGSHFLLRYDTLKFDLAPTINCNAIFPLIEKIAPKEYYRLYTQFRIRNKETKMKLGFDLCEVDRFFKINKAHNYRTDQKYHTLWSSEKAIGRDY